MIELFRGACASAPLRLRRVLLSALLVSCSAYSATPEELRAAALKIELGQSTPVTIHGPFAIAGDISPEELREAISLLDRVDEAMQRQFGMKPLAGPYRLYLFKDDDSYRAYCREHLGLEPVSPYGFFVEDRLVMNYGTGSGTLVHELTHAYLSENLREVPAWFNEGLASLYERSTAEGGEIRGYPNWRLPVLQAAIARGETVPLATLLSLPASRFQQDEKRGLYYAESRYLVYYLQEEGRLIALFQALKERRLADDPDGAKALAQVGGKGIELLAEEAWALAWTLEAL
jgi:hypothetical protein